MGRLVSIGEASQIKGVSIDTRRKWETEGKIKAIRTSGGHRRYDLAELMPLSSDNKKTVAYCRVSSQDQKADLERQALVLAAFCESHGWQCELIQDLGSGLNYKKKGLRKLIEYIMEGQVDRLVITHKDRRLRFGSELIFARSRAFWR